MCGIAGIVNFNGAPVSPDVVNAMTISLAHRGPDGSGVKIQGSVGMGHRRLSIIDPTGGAQPMSNEDGQVWITFNGEIYNYRSLRTELQSKGHLFKSNSDTETIIHAYEEWGMQCVERFRGMFAFGIMDFVKGTLFLARDHFGIKPLYYLQTEKFIAFASELQALKQIPDIKLTLDPGAIDQFLWLQYIAAPATAFCEIKKLEPAHYLSFSISGNSSGPQKYWDVHFNPNHSRTTSEWAEALDAALYDSVKAHLISDVPFGAFLSGGVDSSLVVAYMKRALNQPVKAFSIGFEEEDFNETHYARFAAEKYGAEHHVEIVKPNALEILPKLVQHYGDLFGDSSAIPTYHVSRLARSHVPMVLSGDGADEAFAGYWSHGNWLTSLLNGSSTEPTLDHWLTFINYISTPMRTSLWRPEYRQICPAPLTTFHKFWEQAKNYSLCNKVQYMDLKTYLPFAILTKVDIASMMNGLEVRTPFVDVNVVELAATIPERMNIGCTTDGGMVRKKLLKLVAERYFPSEFLHRPKMGFGVPIAKWFAPGGELCEILVERLLGRSSTLHEMFEPLAIGELLAKNAAGPLWLLLYLEEWLRQQHNTAIFSRLPESAIDINSPAKAEVEFKQQPVRPRILLIADVPNWIFERHCLTLKSLLSDEFECTILYDNQPYEESSFDLIYPLEWYKVKAEAISNPRKYITGIRSHLVWPDYDFHELVQYLSTHFALVHVVSRRLYKIFAPYMPNLRYVTHGVDTDFFSPVTTDKQSGQTVKIGWAGNRKSLGKKGFSELIEPLGSLPGIELVFCGYSDRNLTISEMREFYRSIDVYVCASDFEGSNNSLLEAASMACAIITTDNGTVPEYLVNGENALIVERTLASFVQAAVTLQERPEFRKQLGLNARKTVQHDWSWRSKAEDFRRFFREALNKQQGVATVTCADQPSVLIACTHFWPSLGGIETIAEHLGGHLVQAGYRIDVATLANPERTSDLRKGMRILSLDTTIHSGDLPKWVLQMRNLILSGEYTACILLADPLNMVIWSLDGVSSHEKTRIIIQPVINQEGYQEWRNQHNFRKGLKAILQRADTVVSLTRQGADAHFFAEEGIKTEFIPNAVECLPAVVDFRSGYGIPHDVPMLLHVANLWPVKNHIGLMQAVRRCSNPGLKLVVIGYPSQDAAYTEAVYAEACLDDRIMLIPGLPPEQIAAAQAAADLVLLASHAEVSPVCILEAMGRGKPWLATPDCGAVVEFAGGIVANLEEFPCWIDYFAGFPDVAKKLGQLGYQHWLACFSWNVVLEAWKSLIDGQSVRVSFDMPKQLAMEMQQLLGDAGMSHRKKQTSLQPLVSVIVPTHNRPDMLKDALQSILDQTFQDFEIIVVNDAGTDVSDVIAGFDSTKILYLQHATNKGLAAARNTGINAAKGKYIAYLDDDDRYYPNHLETLVSHLEKTGNQVAYTEAHRACQQWQGDAYEIVKRDVPFSRDCDPDDILIDNCTPVLCVMHQRSCLEKAGLFDESLHRHEDWDLWIRMSRYYAFSHIRKLTCEFSHRLDESTMTGGNPLHFLASYREVCQKYREFAEGKPWIIRDQKRVEWNFLYAGYEYIEQQVAPLLIPVAAPVASQALQLQNLHRKGITDQQVAAATARLAAMAVVGDDNRAAALLREALQHDPEYLLARLELISRLLKTRALDEAAEHIELLLAMKPGDADLSCALADIFAAKGSVAAAQTILCTAAEANKDNPELAKRLALCQTFTVKTDQHSLKPACSIIIPVFNKLELTQPCLEAIKRFTESSLYELIVVDNASTDGTAEYLKNCGHARVISNQENKGFARACNQGACAAGTDLLLFLNNDTVVHEGWLQMLLDCLEQHPKAGIVGCRLLYPDGTVQHAGVGITVDGIGEHLFSGFSADYPAVIQPRLLQAVTAACMLVRRNCFNAVGGFDEGYINGFEDVDFCLKARRLGYDVRYCPDTRIVHYEESSPGRNLYESYNKQRFRQRWQSEIKPDFAAMYETAGLIRPIDCDEADDAYQCYGHRNGALFMYLQIIEKFPGDAGAYLNIARILLQYRRFDDAREFVEKALRITPYFKQAQELKHQLTIR